MIVTNNGHAIIYKITHVATPRNKISHKLKIKGIVIAILKGKTKAANDNMKLTTSMFGRIAKASFKAKTKALYKAIINNLNNFWTCKLIIIVNSSLIKNTPFGVSNFD